jgi:hypothetical protein
MTYRNLMATLCFACISSGFAQEIDKKATELNEVNISKTKKAIEQKADRTIFDFAEQAHLNSGSVLEGIKKLPGLIVSDIAGMLYQGKQLDVYLNGRPLNISSNELNAYLEGMPANAIEKIEVITQPGAEFPATSGGAIMNIITNKNAKNYLSATYTNSTNVTNYDRLRWRTNNNLLLNAKNKYFGWQLNLGQNYRENALSTELTNEKSNNLLLSKTTADRFNRGYFIKSALTFDLGKDRLLLNYDVNSSNNSSYTLGEGINFATNDYSNTIGIRQDAVLTYQKKFDDKIKRLDFVLNYNNNKNDFNLSPVFSNIPNLENTSNQKVFNSKFDYVQPLKILEESKLSLGALYEELLFETSDKGLKNLEYKRRTSSAYLEFQTSYKKFNFILGTRAEDYSITGKTNTADLNSFKQFRLFPNASLQYNFTKQINFNLNYNKKITLPSTTSLNPNNTNYQNPNLTYTGNPQLQPTIFDNFEVKLSAFDYAFVGYSMSSAQNQVINTVSLDKNVVGYNSINIPNFKIHNFNIGMPVPYMLFTKGIKETMKMNVNPDKMNFLFLYAGYQLHQIPAIETKGFWIISLMSQIVLPKEIKFVLNYRTITSGGNFNYFVIDKPFNRSLDLSLTKKFLSNQLTVSINADDILNTTQASLNSYATPLLINTKSDTRRFGFTLNYKIPTRNKMAKEDQNLLNKDKKEENSPLIN